MKRRYLILFSLSGFILSLDQLTKYAVQAALEVGESRALIPGFISLTYIHNAGFAFGLLGKVPPSLQEVFLIGIPSFALLLIVLIFIKLQDDQMPVSLALTAIFGGAIGNLMDRVQHGYVVDLIEVRLGPLGRLPYFNVADFAIIAGVVLMFYNTLMQGKGRAEPA